MTRREFASYPKQRSTSPNSLKGTKTNRLSVGTRFFQGGHWWEIDGYINGRATGYYKCKPACDVESRFYTESEVRQALDDQLATMNLSHTFQDLNDRGTGRLAAASSQNRCTTINPSVARRKLSPSSPNSTSGKADTLKILLVGTRDAVKKAISVFHSLGYANTTDWSPFQARPNSKEVLSILTKKI